MEQRADEKSTQPRNGPSNALMTTSLQLRAIAVSAPDWISGEKFRSALNSTDPASLFNACRYAADLAQKKSGCWADSNWAVARQDIRKYFLLMYSLDDLDKFETLILDVRPNLLFLGAMTLCMPGAVECAKLAKELLGDEIVIVLGGRHSTETIYLENEKIRTPSSVLHHKASPGKLIRDGRLPPIFDIIISGEAEQVIAEIGRVLCKAVAGRLSILANGIEPTTPGLWIADFPTLDHTIVSSGIRLSYDKLPSIVSTFGIAASFDVFNGRMTSHIFSDTGPGCVYDCHFCSERRSITGSIQNIIGAPRRLYRQLEDTVSIVAQDHAGKKASAFVEDSIFLSGSPLAINQLCDLLERKPLKIVFGGQFTIDQIIRRKTLIRRLKSNGLDYIFVGLETFEPEEIGGMNKDIDKKSGSWQIRFADALDFLIASKISCGCALLFGLGEAHTSRISLLEMLITSRKKTGQPIIISANWAVQHPLRSCTESVDEDYLRWGTPKGALLTAFHRFGEASVEYPLFGVAPPVLSEVKEIIDLIDKFEAHDE